MNQIKIHHGTCDNCQERHLQVYHYNYLKQLDRDFRICSTCYSKIDYEIKSHSNKNLNNIRKTIADKSLFFQFRAQKAIIGRLCNIIRNNKQQIKVLMTLLTTIKTELNYVKKQYIIKKGAGTFESRHIRLNRVMKRLNIYFGNKRKSADAKIKNRFNHCKRIIKLIGDGE